MIRWLIEIYILLLIVDAVMSFVPNPAVQHHPVARQLRKVTDVTLKPVRDLLPPNLPFDPSPIIVIMVLRMLASFL
jgi:YggT family protein